MKRMFGIMFCFVLVSSTLFGVQKRSLPARKQYLLSSAIETRDVKTIKSLMDRYDIEAFVPKDLFKQDHVLSVVEPKQEIVKKKKQKKKRTRKKKKKTVLVDSDDFGLHQAVLDRKAETVRDILQTHQSELKDQAINKSFEQTLRGKLKTAIRSEIAEEFLVHKETACRLSGDVLDKAVNKFIKRCFKQLFSILLGNEKIREKLCRQRVDEAEKSFQDDLRYAVRRVPSYLIEFLSYEKLADRYGHLDFIPQKIRDAALAFDADDIFDLSKFSQKEKQLFRAAEKDDEEAVEKIFTSYHKILDKKNVSKIFIKSVKKRKEKLERKLEVIKLFLTNPNIKVMLNEEALNNALIKSLYYFFEDVFLILIEDVELQEKLCICKKTEESLKSALKKVASTKKNMARKLLSKKILRDRVKPLNCIPQEMIDAAERGEYETLVVSIQDYGLLDAVIEKNKEEVKNILKDHCEDLNDDALNRAFTQAVIKEKDEEIARMFLEQKEIRDKFSGRSLISLIVRIMDRSFSKFYLMILNDEIFRAKICACTCQIKKTSLYNAYKRFVDKKSLYIYEALLYSNLKAVLERYDFITPEVLAQAQAYATEKQEIANRTHEEKKLSCAVNNDQEEIVKDLLERYHNDRNVLSAHVINQGLSDAIRRAKKRINLDVVCAFLEHSSIHKILPEELVDEVVMKALENRFEDLLREVLRHNILCEKTYRHEAGKPRFDKKLKAARKKDIKLMVANPVFRKKLEHFGFVKKLLKDVSEKKREEEQALLDAVKQRDDDEILRILGNKKNTFDEAVINEVIQNTVKGRRELLKKSTIKIFLDHKKTRGKLNGNGLDKLISRSISLGFKDIILKILNDEELCEKVHTSTHEEIKESFEKGLKYILKTRKKLFYEFLLPQDLCKRLRSFNFVTPDLIDEARAYKVIKDGKELLDAVKGDEESDIREILGALDATSSGPVINKAFVKTMTGEHQNLKPHLALVFLDYQNVIQSLTARSVDKVVAQALRYRSGDLLPTILSHKSLRDKIYVYDQNSSAREKTMIEKALKVAPMSAKSIEFLSYPEVRKRLKHLVAKDVLKAARQFEKKSQKLAQRAEDVALVKAAKKKKKDTVAQILKDHHKKLGKEAINIAFLRTVTGGKKGIRPKIALLFLKYKAIKKKLSEDVLDNAIIKCMQEGLRDLFEALVGDKVLKNKLCKGKNKKTWNRFENALKSKVKNGHANYFKVFLVDPVLRKRVKRFKWLKDKLNEISEATLDQCSSTEEEEEPIPSEPSESLIPEPEEEEEDIIQEEVNSIFTHGFLLRALEKKDISSLQIILKDYHEDIEEEFLQEVFISSIKKEIECVRRELANAFFQVPEVKARLHDDTLDLAVIMCFQHSLDDLFTIILSDPALRNKLYKTKRLDEALIDAAKHKKKGLKTFLSHRSLRRRLSLNVKRGLFEALFKTYKDVVLNCEILTLCLDDPKFCDDIQDSTLVLESVLRFVDTILVGNDLLAKTAVSRMLEVVCDHGDLEEIVLEISEEKRFNGILQGFGSEEDFLV